jgi:anti-anti-sigma factor
MRISERPIRDTTVLELHGTLTGPAATELLDATVRRVTRAGAQRLVVNLGDVPSIDAAGLGALVAAYGVVRQSGGTLGLARVGARLHELLVACRLVTVLETFDSVEEAVSRGSGASPDGSPISPASSQLSETSLDVIQRFLLRASLPPMQRVRWASILAIGRPGSGPRNMTRLRRLLRGAPANAGASQEES